MFAALMEFIRARKLLPHISDTERQALEAGQVWIDGEILGDNPDFTKMLAQQYIKLTPEEQGFLDGPTEEVCRMIDRYQVTRTRRVPEPVLACLNPFLRTSRSRRHLTNASRLQQRRVEIHDLFPTRFIADGRSIAASHYD